MTKAFQDTHQDLRGNANLTIIISL